MENTPTQVEHVLLSSDIIVSKSDAKGDITYANPIFMKLAGYTKPELIEHPHALIRHPDMPKLVFKHLWDNIEQGKDVYAFVKNLSKDGGFYWVFAYVRKASNPDGSFRNYVSTRKVMSQGARKVIEPLYAEMLSAEESGGMDASFEVLAKFFKENDFLLENFNEVMKKLQNII